MSVEQTINQNRSAQSAIRISGASANNLKKVDCSIPLQQFTVVAGPSGSGKTSLLFDVLWHESRRRYWETQLPTRQWDSPSLMPTACESIGPIPPMVAVTQRMERLSQWQTVGDLTDLNSSLRVLFASLGTPHCPECHQALHRLPIGEMVDQLLELHERTKLMLMAPIDFQSFPEELTPYEAVARLLDHEGMVRVKWNHQHLEWADIEPGQITPDDQLAIIVDRLILKPGIEARIRDSLEVCLRIGNNQCLVDSNEEGVWKESQFRTDLRCSSCQTEFPIPSVRLLNPRSAIGVCTSCSGKGQLQHDGDQMVVCPECDGSKLNAYAGTLKYRNWTYPQLQQFTLHELRTVWRQIQAEVEDSGNTTEKLVLQRLTEQCESRLMFLDQVGVCYLQSSRELRSLSQGELQRCRLAAALGVGLSGVCYLLDEPSVGLHPADVHRLKLAFEQLLKKGNSVLCVEHDPQLLEQADHLILMGPGGGSQGGAIVDAGRPEEVLKRQDDLKPLATIERSGVDQETEFCELKNITVRNLNSVDVKFPLEKLTAITGVSGSGKSTLCFEALLPAVRSVLDRRTETQNFHVTGAETFQRVLSVGHLQFGDSKRSLVFGALQLLPELRNLFAKTKQAKLRGFTAKRFSLEHPSGRCPRCEGTGKQRTEGSSRSFSEEDCSSCNGLRFNRQTLSVKWKEHSIADVLQMTLQDLADLFASVSSLSQTLNAAVGLGLGYLQAGEPTSRLSGGERQRILLARACHEQLNHSLLILDEPTTGLSRADTHRFLQHLQQLLSQKNTILTISHDLDLIQQAGWVIDLGPGGGPEGGDVLYQGIPEELLKVNGSRTGQVLKQLNRSDA